MVAAQKRHVLAARRGALGQQGIRRRLVAARKVNVLGRVLGQLEDGCPSNTSGAYSLSVRDGP